MKNMKLSKILLIVMVAVGCAFMPGKVMADTITPETINNNTTTNTTTVNNTVTNTSTNTTPTNVISSPTNTSVNKTNTSTYNTTNLPQTGAEDYTPVFIIMGICVIAAGFAYKKMNDYKKL